MTVITNTALTFSTIGQREDLLDVIFTISPTDTVFSSTIGTSTANAVYHEWQTDTLQAAGANAQLEGNDYSSFTAVTPTQRVGNRCQISSKDVVVSGTLDAVDKAGRVRELVYQLRKKSNEIKRDIEFVLTNNQAPVTGSSSVARQLRPLCGWYQTNANRGAGGANGTASASATDGTQRPVTEAMLKTMIQSCWVNGGTPDLIMCGPTQKVNISAFTGNATRFDQSEDKKLVAAIDVYVSDFGEHKIVANRFQRDRDLHVLDTSLWATAYLRPLQSISLAKTGDAEKAILQAEYTLEARNEAGSGIIADLS
ncbi:MAG TPA: DUF5309 domain-containing protein [Dongiaceae bacterium]|jgi:hypothetical protein|nr:DUF5309 domain-containing protein [Dongiaceae bacterium]